MQTRKDSTANSLETSLNEIPSQNTLPSISISFFLFWFQCPEDKKECTLWSLPDLLIFIVMGVIGGLLGALFNQLNYYLTRWRILHVIPKGKVMRMLEALLVIGVTTTFTFTASMILGQCQERVRSLGWELQTDFCRIRSFKNPGL